MPHRLPPDNDHDLALALWHAVIGVNGDGICTQVRALKEDVEEIKENHKNLVTKDMCLITHNESKKMRSRNWYLFKDLIIIIGVVVAIISGIVTVIITTGA